MNRHFVTVAVPFAPRHANQVVDELNALGNPAGGAVRTKLDAAGYVHFVSMSVLSSSDTTAHLLLEASTDATDVPPLEHIARTLQSELQRVLMIAHALGSQSVHACLERHEIAIKQGSIQSSGLIFPGTPGMDVWRIKKEEAFASWIREWLRCNAGPESSLAKLERARTAAFEDVNLKWALNASPVPLLGAALRWGTARLLLKIARTALLPLLLFVAIGALLARLVSQPAWSGAVIAGGALVLGIASMLVRLRIQEMRDAPDDSEPDAAAVQQLLQRENAPGFAQNHLTGVTTLKPGRATILQLALWYIGQHVAYLGKPGSLTGIESIHAARWVMLPGTKKLLFFSNYDGSWASYLDDFTTRAPEGVNLLWGNTLDYPRTRWLVREGSRDGARFRRWGRRQTLQTNFWYSAYPQLTVARIRSNAAVRHGFASATTEEDAARWLQLLGVQAQTRTLDDEQIPALAFGGLSRLRYSHSIIVKFANEPLDCRRWLAEVAPSLSFGERVPHPTATLVGFSSSGLARLGLDRDELAQFPTAFQHGMSDVGRSRVLGDHGSNAPDQWWWGQSKGDADAILMLYAHGESELLLLVQLNRVRLQAYGHTVAHEVPLIPLPSNGEKIREPFGSIDGISQPVIRGTRKECNANPIHVVEPGEIILGHADQAGYIAPTPRMKGLDVGRNGTFLVVRQLEQKTMKFERYLDEAATVLAATRGSPNLSHSDLREWIAAKMIGRWRWDGSSIVRNPEVPTSPLRGSVEPDNDFLFGAEDPHGHRCPFGAHIRRSNPRDGLQPQDGLAQIALTNQRRILRVGRSFHVRHSDKARWGILFMCLNSDIEEQFEFVQQTWIGGPHFHGLRDEVDPVVGQGCPGARRMSIPTANGPLYLRGLQDFVEVKGGEYFFLPSKLAIAAFCWIAPGSQQVRRDEVVAGEAAHA